MLTQNATAKSYICATATSYNSVLAHIIIKPSATYLSFFLFFN